MSDEQIIDIADYAKRLDEHAQRAIEALRADNARLTSELAASEARCAALQQQAEQHAQEARAANASLRECYQAVTGATGEPGNWNGAKPVREYVEGMEARCEALIERRRCGWTKQDPEDDTIWDTGCGRTWLFNDGGPVENDVRFCHGCGFPIDTQDDQETEGECDAN